MIVSASLRLGHFWQIRDLFGLPNHRRLGVGRTLLELIRAAAIGAGALRLVLQTEADNTPALRLACIMHCAVRAGLHDEAAAFGSPPRPSYPRAVSTVWAARFSRSFSPALREAAASTRLDPGSQQPCSPVS